jgi:hypothetical protein
MARAAGYLLILAGVGIASTLLPLGSDADSALRLPDVLSRWGGDDVPIVTVAAVEPAPSRAAAPASTTPRPDVVAQPASASPVVVTLPPRSEPAQIVQQPAVGRGTDPAGLARELQRELRRVGCYAGDLDGVWAMASRRAMKAFIDRVNAALPVDTPDPILLSLIKAHHGDVCGKPCPAHERFAEDGRCLPTAVLAHLGKRSAPSAAAVRGNEASARPAPAISGWTATVSALSPAVAAVPPPGRMALAGPQAGPPPAAVAETAPAPSPALRASKEKSSRAARVVRREERRVVQRSYPRQSRFVETFFRNLVLN